MKTISPVHYFDTMRQQHCTAIIGEILELCKNDLDVNLG